MYAFAIDTFPPVKPSISLEMYSTHNAPPIPKMK